MALVSVQSTDKQQHPVERSPIWSLGDEELREWGRHLNKRNLRNKRKKKAILFRDKPSAATLNTSGICATR